MSKPTFLLAAAVLALVWAPTAADAFACPNYPFPSVDERCVEHGFCGYVEPEAFAGTAEDRPLASKTEGVDPVTHTASAMAAMAGALASGSADASAGFGFVREESGVDGSAATTTPLEDSVGRASTVTAFRVTDLTFTGPTTDVEASLNLVFDGSFSLSTTGDDADERAALTAVVVGGGLCNSGGQILEFVGERNVSQIDAVGNPPTLSISGNTGLLEDVPLDEVTEFVLGPFSAPTGEPLHIELWMFTTTSALALGGSSNASSTYVFSLPLDGSPIFDLPAGYSADSSEANIVANALAVPEPDAALAALVGLIVLSIRARSRAAR